MLRASRAVSNLKLEGDEVTGFQILLKACEAPFRQIVANSGFDSGIILDEVLSKGSGYGFNVATSKVEDMVASGVVDSFKVVKSALQYAVSSAGIVLLSEVLIGDIEDDEED